MEVSFYNYKRMNEFLRKDIREELSIVLSLDSDYELFSYQYKNEKKIAAVLGRGYGLGFNCGTAALQFSLQALGVKPGDEVITVPNTYVGTMHSIHDAGAIPVLVDVYKDTLLMDIDNLAEAITEKTKAIMPVHLYGQMCDMDAISKIAKRHNLFIVEDSCQSHLAKFRGRYAGSKGDSACYSFYPNKGFGGIADGGMAITKNRRIYKKFEQLRNPTSNSVLLQVSGRTPAFLDWMEIAFVKCKMKYYQSWIERKRAIAKQYLEELRDLPLVLPGIDKRCYHTFKNFVIRTPKRNKLQRFLKRKKIQTAIHYPEPMHLLKPYQYLGNTKGDFPVSEESCATILSLPSNAFLTTEEVDFVIRSIKQFF